MDFKDIMNYNSPYNEQNISKAIEKIKAGTVIPYIGAGMSMIFDGVYPSWNGFLDSTFSKYVPKKEKETFDSLDFEQKANFLHNEIGNITFVDHLKETFSVTHLERNPIEFVSKPIYLLPVIFDKGLILTTNYDKVIEKTYGLHQKIPTVTHPGHFEALNHALRDQSLAVFKIHGDIAEPQKSIILSKEQYDRAYATKDLIQTLEQAFITKELLFLGCSLVKDKPIQLLCNISAEGMRNFAIVPCKHDEVRSKRLQLENEFYTQPILYPEDHHECVYTLLSHIAREVNNDAYEKSINIYRGVDKEVVQNSLDDEWFYRHINKQIKNLGDRYLPDLNIELELSNVFQAMNRSSDYKTRFTNRTDNLLVDLNETNIKDIKNISIRIRNIIVEFDFNSNRNLPIDELLSLCNKILAKLEDELSYFYQQLHSSDSKNITSIQNSIYKLNHAYESLDDYSSYLNSDEVAAFNNPYIFLYGDGGIGKSHILAETIREREFDGCESLLFLGQHFKEYSNPLPNMLKELELSWSSEVFFNFLNKRAEKNNKRIIIFIDALNEGNGKIIWKEYLAGIVEQMKQYPWLGLVVTIRTEYVNPLFAENQCLENEFVTVRHKGFSTIEYKAIKKYFDYYNVQFNDLPFAEQEFRNPLFLRLLCEGFRNEYINLSDINITDVHKKYLNNINQKISTVCGYSRHINLVKKSIDELVKYKYTTNTMNNLIPLDDAYQIIANIEQKYNVNNSVFDELLSNGVITQNKSYDNFDYIYITYEKLDDYLYAHLLVDDLEIIGDDNFREKYKHIYRYGDVLEALSLTLSERSDIELFNLFDGKKENVINAFCNSLKWRKSDTISDTTMNYINEYVLKYKHGFESLMEVLLLLSTKINHYMNADKTTEYISNHSMPDRDAIFIPFFDKLFYEEGSSINRLIDWCYFNNGDNNTLDETIRLAAELMALFLISSNRKLRDKTTKALIRLLSGRIDILISILDKYKDIDDPYVIERLYAVSFGCVVSEKDNTNIERIAQYTFDTIFKKENVYPNILLRDYAKSIVEFALYKIPDLNISLVDIQPPYKSNIPNIPTDEEISRYRFDYTKSDFKDYYMSQNSILSSMKVEYDREGSPGGYGDFGRYTFQSYFSAWDDLDFNNLKNIAIQRIFNLGYDVEKHGKYDLKIGSGRFNNNSVERIGKKYQWIALYELAAQVSDNYKMKYHTDEYGNTKEIFCKGAYEPSLRNIDPTAMNDFDIEESRLLHNKLYSIPSATNSQWLSEFNDLPAIEDLLVINYDHVNYSLLNGWYIWTEEKNLGEKRFTNPKKDMWIQINSYIVKKESYDAIVKTLKNKDFMGRWLSEPNDNYYLYNKEYYWSEAYEFYRNPYYCGEEWVNLDKRGNFNINNTQVLIPSCRYISERDGDSLESKNSLSWYKPCDELFRCLHMRHGSNNSTLYGANGEILCFDSNELLRENIGLFIDLEKLNDFLRINDYKIFWTLLAEKRIIGDSHSIPKTYPQPRLSGLITMDNNGDFISSINSFED